MWRRKVSPSPFFFAVHPQSKDLDTFRAKSVCSMIIPSQYFSSSSMGGSRGWGGQLRIQDFQNRGARSRRGRILGVWECYEALSHIFSVFVVRLDDKIDIVSAACSLQWKYMRVMLSKFTKTNPQKFSNRGARARCTGPGSAFGGGYGGCNPLSNFKNKRE